MPLCNRKNVVTVWSAPNYCYRCGNVAAIMQIRRPLTENVADIIVDEYPAPWTAENNEDSMSAIKFSYFFDTEHSVHGPKGEARSLLVPYFL
jgi:hypothetical protein